jgi:putative ABC transport system substrate-binding protein
MFEMRRREFILALGSAAAAWPLAAYAQQLKVPRIGALVLTDQDGRAFGKALREGLRELGLIEGQNYVLELRSADAKADRLPELAQELVRLKVDVIAAVFTPCALAAKQATREIPIFVIAGDPIGTGLVASLARPGGNITGLSNMGSEAAGKCVELFRDMLPSLSRVAVLANPVDPFTRSILEQVQLAGRTTGIEIAPVAMVRALDEVEAAFAAIAKERAGAVVVQAGIFFQNAIADLAIKYRLPSASVLRPFVEAGGLLSYGADISHMYRRSVQDIARHQACGPARRAAHKIRAGDQYEDREGNRHRRAFVSATACRRGDRVAMLDDRSWHEAAVRPRAKLRPLSGVQRSRNARCETFSV